MNSLFLISVDNYSNVVMRVCGFVKKTINYLAFTELWHLIHSPYINVWTLNRQRIPDIFQATKAFFPIMLHICTETECTEQQPHKRLLGRATHNPLVGAELNCLLNDYCQRQSFLGRYSRCRLDLEIRGFHYRKTNILKRLINKKMLYCPWVLVAMEIHFYVFTLMYQYSFEISLREYF